MKLNKLGIVSFLHCRLRIEELPENESPMSYQSVQVGWTKEGIQVWCKRHDCNMIHIDFEGKQHPADLTRAKT